MVDNPHGKGVTFTIRSAPVGYAAEYIIFTACARLNMCISPLMFKCILYHFPAGLWAASSIRFHPHYNHNLRILFVSVVMLSTHFLSPFYSLTSRPHTYKEIDLIFTRVFITYRFVIPNYLSSFINILPWCTRDRFFNPIQPCITQRSNVFWRKVFINQIPA